MPVWPIPPVEIQPVITLDRWQIIRLPNGDCHFVGYNPAGLEGRVSNIVTAFDQARMRARTKSGRIYELVGAPGWSKHAQYVLGRWCALNSIEVGALEYVTPAALAGLPIE
ncbi:hypothetical protein GCM10011611_61010 [Aliidongia dinghuensis]|uniref:Uncharacterized protein n=1 Tax=Aliidongia dinghuensis TaxID=1867774 RepID=A0A8J3E6N3_9PROT|nr:hypothetical protein [Aliidongia dinghuensis]GGF46323.1 hypothetical protein GCM10011611_61010 [Aliidongia dinghuensis]